MLFEFVQLSWDDLGEQQMPLYVLLKILGLLDPECCVLQWLHSQHQILEQIKRYQIQRWNINLQAKSGFKHEELELNYWVIKRLCCAIRISISNEKDSLQRWTWPFPLSAMLQFRSTALRQCCVTWTWHFIHCGTVVIIGVLPWMNFGIGTICSMAVQMVQIRWNTCVTQ